MALVSYSESEGSDTEAKVDAPSVVRTSTTSNKPSFQKVVDRSNPQKIRVKLPSSSTNAANLDGDGQEPPTKKARAGPGTFGGFNSLLPAPKRAGDAASRKGLSAGLSLKTSTTPGFSREPIPADDAVVQEEGDEDPQSLPEVVDVSNIAPAAVQENTLVDGAQGYGLPKKSSSIMFKPLSVAKKTGKKRKLTSKEAALNEGHVSKPTDRATKPAEKHTLFPVGTEPNNDAPRPAANEEYRPMLYRSSIQEDRKDGIGEYGGNPYGDIVQKDVSDHVETYPDQGGEAERSQSLDTIAADLNLSASAKRQLFGRNKNNSAPINIVSFDTDREYAANETLRQAGEQAQHNPVRAIAPGKHSLKQLVSAASNQKDALEEQFASGRRNKKEAGSKYGW